MEKIQPYTVLAVDDNLLNLKMIEKSLSREGYQIFIAGNGSEGRALNLVEAADRVLYQAKRQGRDRIVSIGQPAHPEE